MITSARSLAAGRQGGVKRGRSCSALFEELLDREARVAQDGSQRPFGDFAVQGYGQALVRRVVVAEDDVAAGLAIYGVAVASEEAHELMAAQDREPRGHGTST